MSTSDHDQLRRLEIQKRDADGPYFDDEEDSNYQRRLTVSLFKPMPNAINIVVDLTGPDGHNAGSAGINLTLEELESIVEFARANRYDS